MKAVGYRNSGGSDPHSYQGRTERQARRISGQESLVPPQSAAESNDMELHYVRMGSGSPLLLIHGLGGSWRSWGPILSLLRAERDVIAIDLPGFGETPALTGKVTIDRLADAVESFLHRHGLTGIDVAGSSMGGRIALELARRGAVGATVALDPGGFWKEWERVYFGATIGASVRLARVMQPVMPRLTRHPIGRTALFAQLSPRPWRLPAKVMLAEMRSYEASPSVEQVLDELVTGPAQSGAPAGSIRAPIVIGWGRQDRVCFPSQAKRALASFPDARVHWFDRCGHYPQWDVPAEAARLILESTGDQAHRPVASRGATLHPPFVPSAPAVQNAAPTPTR